MYKAILKKLNFHNRELGSITLEHCYIIHTADPACLLVVPRQLKKTWLPVQSCLTVSSLMSLRSAEMDVDVV